MSHPFHALDALTKAETRAALFVALDEALGRMPLSLLILDLDHFKSVNDSFGHARGDAVLVEFAKRIREAVREGDRLFRYGGDEFVLIIPGVSQAQAHLTAERLLQTVQAHPFGQDPPLSLSMSVGLAEALPTDTPQTLFERADQHLYAAKRQGRSRVAQALSEADTLEGRWLEREAAKLSLHHFLQSLPQFGRGLLLSRGPKGAGHSRFLEEAAKMGHLLGYRLVRVTGQMAYATHAYGALLDGIGLEETQSAMVNGAAALAFQEPTLWLIDQPQWLDPASRSLLRDLLEHPNGVYGVIATNPDDSGVTWPNVAFTEEVRLGPLSLEGTRALLRARLLWEAPADFVQWLWEHTGGLPSPMAQTLQALLSHGGLLPAASGYLLASDYSERLPIASVATALPKPASSLIGRDRELLQLKGLLHERPLVTLVGQGGMGKTHLAMQAALEMESHYPDGVQFVALAGLDEATKLAPRLVQALGLKAIDQPEEVLLRHLQRKRMLLVLDNFEQLLEGVELVQLLLRHCQALTVLVTSRERLGLPEEWILPLEGLDQKATGALSAAERMLVHAAKRISPDLALGLAEQDAIKRICQMVGGMPLGLELAAAWVKVLSLPEIASEIESNMAFLRRPEGQDDRHSSLEGVFESSWKLLHPEEQRTLARLAVFRGGFERDGAHKVAGASVSVLLGLVHLSLLQRDSVVAGRYVMHELLRQFAVAKLNPQELRAAQQAHAEYFVQYATLAEPELRGPQQQRWIDRTALELDNVRLAFTTLQRSRLSEQGLQLACGLHWFYYIRGLYRESVDSLQLFLQMDPNPNPLLKAHALQIIASRLRDLGELSQSYDCLQQSQALFLELGDRQGLSSTLHLQGVLHRDKGDLQAAQQFLEQALELRQETGDRWGQATSLNDIGIVMAMQNQDDAAAAYFYQSLELKQEIGDEQGVAYALGNLAIVTNDAQEKQRWLYQSLTIKRRLNDRLGIANSTAHIADTFKYQNQDDQALREYATCLAIYHDLEQMQAISTVLQHCMQVLERNSQPIRAYQIGLAISHWQKQNSARFTPGAQQTFEADMQRLRDSLSDQASPLEAQPLTLGEATLIIAQMATKPLAHWG